MKPLQLASILLALTFVSLTAWAQDKQRSAAETIVYFESGRIPELKLVIAGEGQQRLQEAPREYTRCSLIEDGSTTLKSIGVKLKGAAGSYRDFDDRPCLTLNIDKYKKDQRFHGMEKFHLNNAVQDESYLSEWLGSELFRKAGIPTPRVSHVRLWINDRDLGLYVLREGFDGPFLKRTFGSKDGNLYDGGFLQDIDSELEMDSGDDPDNRDDLLGLAIACYNPDPSVRKSLIAERLDMDQFLTFMAVERLCGHWDGYSINMNNYRVYFPSNGKGIFLPHGMDQLFGDPGAGLYDHAPPLLSAAVMQNDELRTAYRARLDKLAPKFMPADAWLAKLDEVSERLQPVLESIDPNLAASHRDRVNEFKERFSQRIAALPELIEQGMPVPVEFDSTGQLQLTDWYPSVEAEEAKVEEADVDGVACFSITREPFGDYSSSWRTQVLLPRGNYRFEARIKTENVIPIPDDQGRGAGLRRSQSGRSNELTGTHDWTLVTYEWQVLEDQRNVELLLELRARHGRVWFERESLKLHRLAE
ncbi:MAG: CotH kinase family protein [Pirellulaceae bacterium]|nr:CotH kinase family protein [Pirellulaceae bacterium]